MLLDVLLTGAMLGWGCFMMRHPEKFYDRFESWKVEKSGRPSKAYLWNLRLSGAVVAMFGVIRLIFSVLNAFGLLDASLLSRLP